MNTEWIKGYENGKESVLCDMLRGSNKLLVIKTLFSKTSELKTSCTDPIEKAKMEGYSEGFRHCLNILQMYGADSVEAYHGIINATIKIDLTEADVKRCR